MALQDSSHPEGGILPERLIFEDNHLLVVDKPACLPTVPDASKDSSLLDLCRAYIKRSRNKPGNVFLAVIHRLDRPVSGVVCFARTSKAASRLSDQMRRRSVDKLYLAVVRGRPAKEEGRITSLLLKDRRRNLVRVLGPEELGIKGAKEARTSWRVLAHREGWSLMLLRPETGRPHQLRVHMATLGCPIVGDLRYGPGPALKDASIALHALAMTISHPTKKEPMTFRAAPPATGPWRHFSQIAPPFRW